MEIKKVTVVYVVTVDSGPIVYASRELAETAWPSEPVHMREIRGEQ
jgi:hypothetical protein